MNKGIAKGVSFDNIHSFNDLDLIFAGAEIPPATPKENYIDIPGADSSLDLTEALGEVKYNDRPGCKFTFTMNPEGDLSDEAFEAKKTEISNLLNGTVRKITLDKDPDYYYYGRCTVNGYAQNKKIKQFVISAKVKPYKYKQNETTVFVPFCGKNLLEVSEANQWKLHGDVTYITNGIRKSGKYYVGFVAYVSKNTDYFLSMNIKKITAAAGEGGRISVYDSTGTKQIKWFSPSEGNTVFEFNSGDYTKVCVFFYSDTNESVGVYEFTNIQLESGAATEYEPYQIITPQDVILSNSRKTVVPIINCTNEIKITFNDNEYLLNAGTHKILDLQLYEGDNPITVDGSGMVTFTYQEGDL